MPRGRGVSRRTGVRLQKGGGLLRLGERIAQPGRACELIEVEKANVGIVRMCGLLGVSRSGCCKWVARQEAGPTGREQRRERLRVKIHQFHAGSQGVNGAPRTCADVREGGEVVTCKMVAGIMWADGIAGISPRPWRPVTTLADQVAHAIADRVGRTGVCWDNAQMESFWSALNTGYYGPRLRHPRRGDPRCQLLDRDRRQPPPTPQRPRPDPPGSLRAPDHHRGRRGRRGRFTDAHQTGSTPAAAMLTRLMHDDAACAR